MNRIVLFSGTGCFLPLLIVLNLLFGWVFLRPFPWLVTEAALILLFLLNCIVITRKALRPKSMRDKVIDTEGYRLP